ncbi:YukJ family protein [Alicyclobacillus fastidiosus]|uniref:YukJ family protein n=1 Tax=Alicyclobacillus fastidiosus TaxID=392011 RepID=A0ABV5AJH7_9BACL|nr:YukJ family protein [Alicyclobacillus fastidiosus]WEH11585.1 YukJ family protein [Alicyclobacillus fastidiosus]
MPIQNYGVIRGQVVRYTPGTPQSPHFAIILADNDNKEYQVDVNVLSRDGSEVLYYANENFLNSMIQNLLSLTPGFTPLRNNTSSGALDYLRESLFDTSAMKPLPINGPSQNDLDAFIGSVVSSAQTSNASVFAFGQYFDDNARSVAQDRRENLPPQGIHDIHMNQGNAAPYERDNGTYQDGGLLVYFPAEQRYVATFLAFQTQAFQTDDNGNPIGASWADEHGGETMEPG